MCFSLEHFIKIIIMPEWMSSVYFQTEGTEIVMVFEIDNFAFNNSLEDTNSVYYKVLNDALATAVSSMMIISFLSTFN